MNQIKQIEKLNQELMWIMLNKGRVHGKNTHLAWDYEFEII